MRIYKLFLKGPWRQNRLSQENWPVYLAAPETCAGTDPDQLQADLGRSFRQVCLRGMGQSEVGYIAETTISAATNARVRSYIYPRKR